MSGGHFDYNQFLLNDISDEIEHLISKNGKHRIDELGYDITQHYSEETIKRFKEAAIAVRKAFVYIHRIDWLVSDDDGEESFHERLNEELEKIK